MKAFQKDSALEADGQYGEKTHEALLQALASCGGRPLSGQALAQQLGVVHTQELDNTAKAVAEWFVQEPDSLRVSGLDLVYTVALDADNNMSHTDDLNAFLYWSGCYGVPEDVTVALLLDDSTAMTAQLYAPQADSAAAELLDDAAGHSELGAAFIDYNGTAYVVAVFR